MPVLNQIAAKWKGLLFGLALGGFVILILGWSAGQAQARINPNPVRDERSTAQSAACLQCHQQPGLVTQLPGAELLPITVAPDKFSASVHAEAGLSCISCHTTITGFPHAKVTAETLKDYKVQTVGVCAACHFDIYRKNLDSVHQKALEAGKPAPTCVDCHDPHAQTRIKDENGNILPSARLAIPQICAQCHAALYGEYKASVHGAALTDQSNIDVPTCIDCHGVHQISNPTTTAFRLASPQICAKCHTDAVKMGRYGISTNVLSTYVADFHGTTVDIFQKRSPDQETNKPVCYDCHGMHDIKSVKDPQGGIAIRQNLLITCQKCHPGANANFPDAWLNHYSPTSRTYPLVYYVNLFYTILIPLVIGGMVLYVITDIIRRLIDRRKGLSHS